MKLFNSLASKIVGAVVIVAAVAGLAGAATTAGFGPDRPTKVYNGPGTPGFDYPVFNSFTNVPKYGDERNFLTGKYPGGRTLTDPLSEVKQDDEITVQILVHNNADPKYNADGSGFARNTRVRVELPTELAKAQQAKAFITADNTNPKRIYDTLDFGSYNGGFFKLDYVEGSARVRGNYIDTAVSDAIIGDGVQIGSKSLNGVVEGCFGEEVLVTFKVRVRMPEYKLVKEVRRESEATTAYSTAKTAELSDTLVWKVTFNNTGKTKLNNVKFIDPIPDHMNVVRGSIKVYNQQNPNGYQVPDTAIQKNGRQIEINLGDYQPTANAFIYFQTKTNKDIEGLCGQFDQKNTAFVQPANLIAISNDALVHIKTGKKCEVVVKKCESLTVDKINRTKFEFTAKAQVENAKVLAYTFTATDKAGNEVDKKIVSTDAIRANYTFTNKKAGDYKVKVVIDTDKGVAEGKCEKTVTVEKAETPVMTCESLDYVKVSRTHFNFTANAYVENAKVKSYTFTATDKNGKEVGRRVVTTDALKAYYSFRNNVPGEYKVKVVIDTDKGIATGNCEQKITVEKPPVVVNPEYKCTDVAVKLLGDKKISVDVSYEAEPENRVKLHMIEYNYGDGTIFNSNTGDTVEHTYANDGTYTVRAKITFMVDNQLKTVDGEQCTEAVTITTPVPPTTPPVTPPKQLPYTGAGSNLALFLGTTMVGMFLFRAYALKKQ